MSKYSKNLAGNLVTMVVLLMLGFINWAKPLYLWFGDSPITRFIWLGLFFVILDIILEIIFKSLKEIRLMADMMGFGKDIRKVSEGFYVVSKLILPDGQKSDYVVIGSSGVWAITVKDDAGKIMFNGDELIQDGVVLAGAVSKSLQLAYGLAGYIKEKLGRDVRVAPVIAFSSFKVDMSEMQKTVRGVFISSRKDTVPLIENTDFQLIDKKTIDDIYNILKK